MRNKASGLAVLATLAVMIVAGAGAQAQEASVAVQRTEDAAVGAAVVHPAAWTVGQEPYTLDETSGYTLWRPDTEEAHDHGGQPALRVALAYESEPGGIDEEVEGLISDYPDLPLDRQTVVVARGHRGVAVGPVPGSTPFTRVYVPVDGRVYSINVYSEEPGEEGLDADDRRLLAGVRFEPPARSEAALDAAPAANSSQEIYPSAAEARALEARDDGKGVAPLAAASGGTTADGRTASSGAGGERRIAGGCWEADPRFFVQTQHGWGANSAANDGIPTGWTKVGVPNFWGQYTHGDLGYGRCTEPYYANDMYAVDYPYNRGDYVFSPFSCARVTFAGRNQTHKNYGIMVSMRSCNGKYVNISAHLSGLHPRIEQGAKVDRGSVIGYAGATGDPSIPVGRPHVHTAFYRYPQQNPDGSPYGGAGLKVSRNHYVGTAARRRGIPTNSRVYTLDRVQPRVVFCRESIRCGINHMLSN